MFCPEKIYKTKKYLILGMKKIRKYDPFHPTLHFVYRYMIHLYKSLGKYNKCKKWLKLSIELNKYTNIYKKSDDDIQDLEDIRNGRYTKLILPVREFIWKSKRNTTLGNGFERWQIEKLRIYFKNKKSYQIMKNICCAKECNLFQCKRKDTKLNKCSKCQSVFYCSKKHQKMDWKIQHRDECNKLEERNMKYTLQKDWKLVFGKDMSDCMLLSDSYLK
eukprot:172568_1